MISPITLNSPLKNFTNPCNTEIAVSSKNLKLAPIALPISGANFPTVLPIICPNEAPANVPIPGTIEPNAPPIPAPMPPPMPEPRSRAF